MNAHPTPERRRRLGAPLALLVSAALALTACGSGEPAGTGAGGGGGGAKAAAEPGKVPTNDVVSGVHEDKAAAGLLPADVAKSGTLNLAASVGAPPSSTYLADGKSVAGIDIDVSEAVAKTLGIRLKRQVASFEAILPALDSGKYDVGTGNFGVTDERRHTLDFVTYINDGQGFATREDSELKKVTTLKQLCGLTVGTGAGTTFEVTLEKSRHLCAEAGRKPYDVKTYSDQSASWAALQQGRIDVVMSTINGLRYAVAQQEGLEFRGEFHRLDVGFAFKKGTKLAPAFQAAVNEIIKNGTYARILKKWDVTPSALTSSKISPPEIK
ncbi:ABC transporter substrate-binding protein [Streptomyces tsukubensis]|uniref:ABC transporter substrate-binding protein n=1 Tax=Streptomyces tsukubensis TaxID=83656 RepID=A0A1V4AE97_9ACTN|nr:ABC transporter substrate-binding protein [Streptomyces tsukubensis]OON82362.1 ABC transporter substrate-binding protein [Streptomyces tsukubensis]QFR92858.1 transporter substrate-binding domain-containing protein [Streptomyces tsukubensis]